MSIVEYDEMSRELRACVAKLREHAAAVELISYRPGIAPGAVIAPGAPIADVAWDDGVSEVITAPPGCAGTVAFINQRLRYDALDASPGQVLLRLT